MATRAGRLTGRLLRWRWARPLFVALMTVIVLATVRGWRAEYGARPVTTLFPHGEIVIGVDASYPPFARAEADGTLSGIDIDVGRALGERLGLPVRFVNMGYDGLYDSLIAGQVDLVISALQIDPMRMADVYYSWAYYNAGLIVVSAAGSPVGTMSDIGGRSLAFEYGSPADTEARAWARRVAPFERQPYATPSDALDAVRLGIADAALVDATTGRLYLRQHPGWDAQYEYVTAALYSIATRIDNRHVWRRVNRDLLALLSDGTIEAILRRWL